MFFAIQIDLIAIFHLKNFTVLCKSNANVICQNLRLFLVFHTLAYTCSGTSFSAAHVVKICCFKFCHLDFHLVPKKFATSTFASSNFRERSWIFHLDTTKHLPNFQQFFMENSREQRTNFDEFRLHFFYCMKKYWF